MDDKGTGPAHTPGTHKGEEVQDDQGEEPGRHDAGEKGADRPTGTRTARDSTGINPADEESITPGSHEMPPN